MKQFLNGFYLFMVVCLLSILSRGAVSIISQLLFIAISLYYMVYANLKYVLPVYFKALNVLLLMFTIYGGLLIISGEHMRLEALGVETSTTEYLKSIYKSLLPVYPFFVFGKQGILKEKDIRLFFIVFLFLAINSYFVYLGSSIGYNFVALLPVLVVFNKKPVVQYFGLAVCLYFIFISAKRGAILCGVLCFVWFIITNLKKVQKKRKWIVVIVSLAVVLAGVYFYRYLMATNSLFIYRMQLTQEGNSSGRDDLYSIFYNHFIHEDNPFRFLFGYGANGTLKISYNFAHNDWLEIATNQGLFGLIVFFVYWVCFFITWRKTKQHPQAFMAVGMFIIVYFLSTLFSMSYNNVGYCASMVLGYYLAVYDSDAEYVLQNDIKRIK